MIGLTTEKRGLSSGEWLLIALTLCAAGFFVGWFLRGESLTRPIELAVPIEQPSRSEASSVDENVRPLAQSGELVNINTADVYELMTLPNIGEVRALAIIAYREEHGAFPIVEAITEVPGLGEKIFLELEAYITVE